MSLNSGTGINDGIYRVQFDDGVEICFVSPGGEVGGLTSGNRTFNLVGKCTLFAILAYYWISNTNIMLELSFDPYKKNALSLSKKEKPSDFFQGTIW